MILGILIVFFVRPSYHSIDTLSMLEATLGIVITALAILGAVMTVITWNSIEDGIKRGIREYEQKAEQSKKDLDEKVEKITNDLDEKMKNISGDLDYAKKMIDLLVKANEPSYMANMRRLKGNMNMPNDEP
jgi:16S rRNA C1402 N4-methylase RsmH